MTAMMTDMTDMMVMNQDIVMVIEKKEIEIMRTIVLIERDIDPPVDMTLGNQKGIQNSLKVTLEELCAEGLPVNSYCPIQAPILCNQC